MAEAVQHSRSEKAPSRDERSKYLDGQFQIPCTDPLSAAHIITDEENAETLEDSTVSPSISTYFPATSSSLSAAVDSNILTLLRLASETLRVGGKLVFFAPHRAIDVSKSSDDQSSKGHGRGKRENAESGEVPASYFTNASHGLSPSIKEDGESTSSGMGVKMSKRKAFKRRARIAKDKDEDKDEDDSPLARAAYIDKGTSRSGPTSPLDFLPPIPDSLTLVGYHEQVMSPSFSRWLCVMQRV